MIDYIYIYELEEVINEETGFCETNNLIIRNINNEEVIAKMNFDYVLHYVTSLDNQVIFRKEHGRNILVSIDMKLFEKNWTVSLSHHPKFINFAGNQKEVEIEGEIILNEKMLYFRTNNDMFFCLDVETGREIWGLQCKNLPLRYQKLHDKIIFLHWSIYLEIDLETGQISKKADVTDIIYHKDIVVDELFVYCGHIYFLDGRNFWIAKYNPVKNCLERIFKVPTKTQKPWKLEQMKIHDNKIYVIEIVSLDQRDLHIIELDEIENS